VFIVNNCIEFIGTIYPKVTLVDPMGFVVLTCHSNGDLEWIADDTIISRKSVLTLDFVSQDDDGIFFCKGLDLNNKTFVASSTVIVAGK